MTLISCRTHNGIRPHTTPGLARVGQRATIPVVAGGSIGFGRIRARAGEWVASAGIVALVPACTDDRIRSRALAAHASIELRAEITIVTGRAIRQCGIAATASGRVADSSIVALVKRRANDASTPVDGGQVDPELDAEGLVIDEDGVLVSVDLPRIAFVSNDLQVSKTKLLPA
jgi:hypothetical protein